MLLGHVNGSCMKVFRLDDRDFFPSAGLRHVSGTAVYLPTVIAIVASFLMLFGSSPNPTEGLEEWFFWFGFTELGGKGQKLGDMHRIGLWDAANRTHIRHRTAANTPHGLGTRNNHSQDNERRSRIRGKTTTAPPPDDNANQTLIPSTVFSN